VTRLLNVCQQRVNLSTNFHVDLSIGSSDIGLLPDEAAITDAHAMLPRVTAAESIYETLVTICGQLGIESQRAPLFALRAARAHAALSARDAVEPEDIDAAVALCLAHRATKLPAPPDTDEPESTQPERQDQSGENSEQDIGQLDDRVLEAVMAVLPDGLLDQL